MKLWAFRWFAANRSNDKLFHRYLSDNEGARVKASTSGSERGHRAFVDMTLACCPSMNGLRCLIVRHPFCRHLGSDVRVDATVDKVYRYSKLVDLLTKSTVYFHTLVHLTPTQLARQL